jgi:hypothetical protein
MRGKASAVELYTNIDTKYSNWITKIPKNVLQITLHRTPHSFTLKHRKLRQAEPRQPNAAFHTTLACAGIKTG